VFAEDAGEMRLGLVGRINSGVLFSWLALTLHAIAPPRIGGSDDLFSLHKRSLKGPAIS